MGRKKKNQTFAFPSATETAPSVAAPSPEDLQRKAEIRKAVDDLPQIFAPEQVEWVFDVYAGLLAFVFSLVLKTDFKLIHDELKFEENEKKALAKPLARICSKYCPAEWAGLQAEFELIGSVGMYTVMAFRRAQGIAEKEKERKKKAEAGKTTEIHRAATAAAPAVAVPL